MPQPIADVKPIPPTRTRWLLPLRGLVVAVALFSAGDWLRTVAVRASDPYPMEWMEGAIVAHTFRWLDGQSIYPPPSGDFIPTVYPPFGYVVQGMAMRILGRGLPAARWASVTATLGIALLMGVVVHRRTRSLLAAVAIAGVFLDAYAACGSWYDQARNDMIFLCLGLGSLVWVTRERLTAISTAGSAILLSLAILTKQQGLLVLPLGFLYLLPRSRRHAFAYAAIAVLIPAVAVILLQRQTDGWFLFYTWTSLHNYPLHLGRVPEILGKLAANLWIPLLCAGVWLLASMRRHRNPLAGLFSIWTLALGLFLASAVSSMLKEGGYVNHFVPVVIFALIPGGFLLGELNRNERRPLVLAVILALIVVQFLIWPHPSAARWQPNVRAAQRHVVQEIAAMPGDVLVLEDAYYGWLAGKKLNADGGSLFWLSFIGLDLPPDLVDKITSTRYSAVVLSHRVEEGMHARTHSARRLNHLIDDHYVFTRTLIPEDEKIQWLRVPRYLYWPRTAPLVP